MLDWLHAYSEYTRVGDLTAYLWLLHNEHHLVWIRIITLLDVKLGSSGLTFVAAAVTALIAFYAVITREILRAPIASSAAGAAITAAICFPAWNALDCSTAIFAPYPITLAFCAASAVMFCGPGTDTSHVAVWRALAIVGAVAASLANGAGLVAFPTLLFACWLCRASWMWTAGIAGVGIVYGIAYLHGTPASETPPYSVDLLHYWIAYLGLPWTRSPVLGVYALPIGPSILIIASALWARSKNTRLSRIAGCLILLSVCISILAAVGRSGLGGDVPPLRYATFLTPLHVAILLLAIQRWRVTGVVALAILLAMCAHQIVASRAAIAAADNLRMTMVQKP
jgi:hypothetical protein